ncbi:hypothetical protein PQX77_021089 [Marasmius sp. AFHP31]|nr:hypothetical protein PQX77_021089 [Marasmius sp. AFHP31]
MAVLHEVLKRTGNHPIDITVQCPPYWGREHWKDMLDLLIDESKRWLSFVWIEWDITDESYTDIDGSPPVFRPNLHTSFAMMTRVEICGWSGPVDHSLTAEFVRALTSAPSHPKVRLATRGAPVDDLFPVLEGNRIIDLKFEPTANAKWYGSSAFRQWEVTSLLDECPYVEKFSTPAYSWKKDMPFVSSPSRPHSEHVVELTLMNLGYGFMDRLGKQLGYHEPSSLILPSLRHLSLECVGLGVDLAPLTKTIQISSCHLQSLSISRITLIANATIERLLQATQGSFSELTLRGQFLDSLMKLFFWSSTDPQNSTQPHLPVEKLVIEVDYLFMPRLKAYDRLLGLEIPSLAKVPYPALEIEADCGKGTIEIRGCGFTDPEDQGDIISDLAETLSASRGRFEETTGENLSAQMDRIITYIEDHWEEIRNSDEVSVVGLQEDVMGDGKLL